VVTGSSGGHIFPALSFIERLKTRCPDVTVTLIIPKLNALGDRPGDCSVKYIFMRPLSGSGLKRITAVFDFLRGSLQSALIVAELHPDVAVGFGSIACAPAIVFAWLFRARTIIHEQNVVPGLSNRILAWFADRIAISFEETRPYLSSYVSKIVFTGNPVRSSLKVIERRQAQGFFGLDPDIKTVLVMGGSQGSRSINRAVPEALSALAGKTPVQVIHLSGKKEEQDLIRKYSELGIKARVFAFLDAMEYAYSAADLCIARAGATTLSELEFFRLPAILVPYPFAGAHQAQNAQVLKDSGSALVIDDDKLASGLPGALSSLIANRELLSGMREKFKSGRRRDPAGDLVSLAVVG
jgi:UDP-N-acetylglucosamine--N-acetylmuramyl-(pentapeptide) pyrophosphoryl-undecaprenol N-acetylglucosamine transferase